MLHTINLDCIACGACLKECPVNAIEAGTRIYTINDAHCIDCACCVPVCPTEAIVPNISPEETRLAWARALQEVEEDVEVPARVATTHGTVA